MKEWLNRIYWDNTVQAYLIAAGSILLAWVIIRILRKYLIGYLQKITQKTAIIFDDLLVKGVSKFLLPYLYLFINYNIITHLTLHPRFEKVLDVAIKVVTVYFVIRLINFIIHGALQLFMQQKNEPPERIRQLSGMLVVVKVITWIMGVIMLVDNLGYDVTTLIAGLGVGGIAIALAAQNILGDLFSYLVIFFDKPFEIGDFIVVGEHRGTVEKIGIKTSHVRSIDGQQLVMPNAELVKSVINNFKRLEKRRALFSIGVVYYTPSEKLEKIPGIIQDIITANPQAEFDRAHLKSFGDFSINYEIVYLVGSPEYNVYMNTHQAICLEIFRRFEKEGIEFAFPTQTVFLEKNKAD